MNRLRLLAVCLLIGFTGANALGQDKDPPEKVKEPDLMARLKKVKGSFSLIVSFRVKKGEEKAFLAAAKPAIAATVKEKGCKRYELHQDLETPTKFVLVERWDSVADIEAHMAADHTKKLLSTLGKIADGPPKIEIAKRRLHEKK
jgi:quinol monooxygenase YgiN